jgi:Fe-S cluster biogenesis protein NfuA
LFALTDDPNYFTYNIAKLGIGLVTLIFDSIFIVQHYCLYGNRHSLQDEDQRSQSGSDSLDTESRLTIVTTQGNSSSIRRSPHSLATACHGCCACINTTGSNISRALSAQFPRESNDPINPLTIAKQLQLKSSNEKPT